MPAGEDAPIILAPYNPSWPQLFEQERALLAQLLAPWLVGPIEHIGSTAIPGMTAKPVIDIMAPVANLESSRPAIVALEPADYLYAPYQANVEHWFCKPTPSFRTHHLHLVPLGSPLWNETLSFRNALRAHPAASAQYITLKHQLAEIHKDDRDAYTAGKTDFIYAVLKSTSARF